MVALRALSARAVPATPRSRGLRAFSATPNFPGLGTYEAVLPEKPGSTRPNKYSSVITQRKTQGAGQAQLYATDVGKIPDGMNKPQVGIASVWYEGNPCNMHLLDVALAAKEEVQARGMVGLRFNSIGVSDGISNGTDGMAYSLQSRDLIADGIETVMGAQFYDANISIPGCDKNMPGCIMAMARVNRPAVMVYGGTIRAGCRPGKSEKLDIISAFQAYGEYVTGKIDDDTRLSLVRSSCPGPGACGGMYTANTMASAIEALGMSVPYSSSVPAWDPHANGGAGGLHPEKIEEVGRAVAALEGMIANEIKPRDIMTMKAFENAIKLIMVRATPARPGAQAVLPRCGHGPPFFLPSASPLGHRHPKAGLPVPYSPISLLQCFHASDFCLSGQTHGPPL
jgi:dihydroxy-acid dehydratase